MIQTQLTPSGLPVPLHQIEAEQCQLTLINQLSVPLPHPNPTKSFWTHGSPDANPLAKEGSEGPLTTDADVVIIGSGITGISAAYHLSQLMKENELSLSVLILEARDFCSGATGRNGGHLTPTPFQGFLSVAEIYDTEEAIRWLALEAHTANSILKVLRNSGPEVEKSVDLVSGGHLDLYFSDTEERDAKTHWAAAKEAGVNLQRVEFLSQEETREKYGPDFASAHYPGHNLWPLKLVTHLFNLTRKTISNISSDGNSTIHLHTQTPVTSIKRLGTTADTSAKLAQRRWLLETPRGSVRANRVIHATNGYAAHLLPFLVQRPGNEGITPTRGQAMAIRASVGTDKILKPSYSANQGYEYWFPRPLNQSEPNRHPLVILGGGREAGGPDFELGITDDSVLNPVVSKTLRRFLPAVYPDGWFEEDEEPEMEWTGIMGYTQSRDPFVGPVVDTDMGTVLEGQYIAAGYNGHGMPRAFGCAEALAQIVVSDITNKTWRAPEWLPDHFLTTSKWRPRSILKY